MSFSPRPKITNPITPTLTRLKRASGSLGAVRLSKEWLDTIL